MRVPTSIAWFTDQSWLMSHIRSTSGPMDSRITRTRSIEAATVGSLPHCIFICLKPMLTRRGPASARYFTECGRISAPLAYVGTRSRKPPRSAHTD